MAAYVNNGTTGRLTKAGASISLTCNGTAAIGRGSIFVGYPLLAPLDSCTGTKRDHGPEKETATI